MAMAASLTQNTKEGEMIVIDRETWICARVACDMLSERESLSPEMRERFRQACERLNIAAGVPDDVPALLLPQIGPTS